MIFWYMYFLLCCSAKFGLCEYLSPKEKEDILRLHNKQRNEQRSSNMAQLSWNCKLEEMANIVAETCYYEHSTDEWRSYDANDDGTKKGENLAASTDKSRAFTASVTDWYDEIKDYDYDSQKCIGVCGHYTQIVWAYTYEIGCARAFCDPLKNFLGGQAAVYDVCHYGPAGNGPYDPFLKMRPVGGVGSCSKCNGGYHTKEGTDCCDADQTRTHKGLCRKTTSCDVYTEGKVKCGREKGEGKDPDYDDYPHECAPSCYRALSVGLIVLIVLTALLVPIGIFICYKFRKQIHQKINELKAKCFKKKKSQNEERVNIEEGASNPANDKGAKEPDDASNKESKISEKSANTVNEPERPNERVTELETPAKSVKEPERPTKSVNKHRNSFDIIHNRVNKQEKANKRTKKKRTKRIKIKEPEGSEEWFDAQSERNEQLETDRRAQKSKFNRSKKR